MCQSLTFHSEPGSKDPFFPGTTLHFFILVYRSFPFYRSHIKCFLFVIFPFENRKLWIKDSINNPPSYDQCLEALQRHSEPGKVSLVCDLNNGGGAWWCLPWTLIMSWFLEPTHTKVTPVSKEVPVYTRFPRVEHFFRFIILPKMFSHGFPVVCLFVCFCVLSKTKLFFEREFLFVALAVLEIALYHKATWNSELQISLPPKWWD